MYIDGIEVHHFKNVSNKLAHNNYSIAPAMLFKLNNNIKDFDIIHLHEYRSAQAVFVQYLAKKHNIPYILQAHGSVMPLFSKQKLKKLFDLGWGNKILQSASKAICLTKKEAEQYKKMGMDKDKLEILPNGVNFLDYENLPHKGIFRNKYGIEKDEKIVLYLARIHRIKGGDLLVEAFSGLITKIEGARLVIAGPDDGFLTVLKEQIEYLNISNRVLFTGPLYGTDKLEAYVDADVYILPSVYEVFGVTVLEACACGTPVIITERCGVADLLSDSAGIVVKHDKYMLQDAIFKVLYNANLQKKLGYAGRDLVKEKFNWIDLVGRLELIYETIRVRDWTK
jgi:glycosyltransferase involved in cell wall biosynthesis